LFLGHKARSLRSLSVTKILTHSLAKINMQTKSLDIFMDYLLKTTG
jgi:hypothetical protein